ncbi:hypothetical protein VKT23_013517 [Stygiomarasmius scandens]|uniref:F-box domain-containing protein n=1 Tax=Marasmiellus scandens TaxID=2682957 RepID=A0ABR1J6E8_9AGAR
MSVILYLARADIPILEHLSIADPFTQQPLSAPELIEFVRRIHNLHKLKLNQDCYLLEEVMTNRSLNLEILTELTLQSPALGDCMPATDGLQILSEAVNLQYCSMRMFVSEASFNQIVIKAHRPSHPFLRTLDLALSHDAYDLLSGDHLLPVFKQLDAPILENLSIQALGFTISDDCIPFLDMLTPRIRSVRFVLEMTPDAWMQCLLCVPGLTSLAAGTFGVSFDWEETLQLLAPVQENVDVLCPELQVISFSSICNFRLKDLVKLVSARQRMAKDSIRENNEHAGTHENQHRSYRRSSKLSSVSASFEVCEELTENERAEISRIRQGGTDMYLRISSAIRILDTPWIGLPGVSQLDGRRLEWNWQDKHTQEYSFGWSSIYSTSGPEGSIVVS